MGALVMAHPALPVQAAGNPIVTENQQPGSSAWQLGALVADDVGGQIKGYASKTSVSQGDSITIYVSVNPPQTYTVDFYRLGWYAGAGGRLRLHLGPVQGTPQLPCSGDPVTGLISCNWTATQTLPIPADWTSGVYVALLTNAQGYQNDVIFVVKDGRPAPLLYQQSVTTYQAYNNYPNDHVTGKSLYPFNSYGAPTVGGNTRAVKVSFDRPYSGAGAGQFFWWEIDLVRWLERGGYDVTYSTDIDTHAAGALLKNSKAFVSTAHDEYWSKEMFDAVQSARDAGVNLAFLGADADFWQIRFETSAVGPNRVIVCYKDASLDPVKDSTSTVNFRNPPVNRTEQALVGIQYTSSVAFPGTRGYVVTNSSHWAYAGTGFKDGDVVNGIVGYEMDRLMPAYPAPPGTNQTLLSHSPYTSDAGVADFANSSIYQAPSGAWVFAAGTLSWSWALDDWTNTRVVSAGIQRMTANILNAFVNGAPGVVQRLAITAPATATAGQAFPVTVVAQDALNQPVPQYTGTVHFSTTDPSPGVVLPADYTFTSADAGSHIFTVTLARAGSQTLTVSDPARSTTVPITVSPGAAAGLTVNAPATVTPGQPFTASVTAIDAQANPVPQYTGTVHFSSSDTSPKTVLPADYTFTSADAGTHAFSLTLATPGSQTITVTDAGNALRASAATTVNAVLDHLKVTAPSAVTAGQPFTVAIRAEDAAGNLVAQYSGTIHFTSTDASPKVVLPADYTLTSADAGTHAFNVTLATPGSQTITVTDAANALQATVATTVNAVLDHLKVTAPSAVTAGQPFTVAVRAEDAAGNPVPQYSGIIHFSSSDTASGVVLPPDSTLTNGQGSFSVKLIKAGLQTVTVADAANALSATASTTVNAAPASHFALASTAAPTAGAAFSFAVTALDPYQNVDFSYAGTVHFTSSDTSPGISLPPDSSLASGKGTFSATLNRAGSQTITGTDTAHGSVSGTVTVQVTAAAAATLSLVAPSSTRSGQRFQVTVTLADRFGNVATGYRGRIHFSSSDLVAATLGDLPADYSFTAADVGTHTFSATLVTVGGQTLTAADTVDASLRASASVTVTLL
jgi:hypothetical protein